MPSIAFILSDLLHLDVISRFAVKLLLAEEVRAVACWLQVVVREERGVLTGRDALRARHIAGLAGAAESLVAATQSRGQENRDVTGRAGGNTQTGARAGENTGISCPAPGSVPTLTSLRGGHCPVTAGQAYLTERLAKKHNYTQHHPRPSYNSPVSH